MTSLDVLYYALALSALLVAVYLAYTLYQLGKTLRIINRLADLVEEKVHDLTDAVSSLSERFGFVGEMIGALVKRVVSGIADSGEKKRK
ncbi:MAG: hypothetical protein HW383_510 [Candidatus Magasanikbacteria bacterium]|nr:hypothetical protein [Candidatus Magasanikbacteria bacterium]